MDKRLLPLSLSRGDRHLDAVGQEYFCHALCFLLTGSPGEKIHSIATAASSKKPPASSRRKHDP